MEASFGIDLTASALDRAGKLNYSGDEELIEWAKIHTPTDEVVVPYDTLESPPEGASSPETLSFFSVVMIHGNSSAETDH
jgi:hypothetical protein